jgi:hypothetical protein
MASRWSGSTSASCSCSAWTDSAAQKAGKPSPEGLGRYCQRRWWIPLGGSRGGVSDARCRSSVVSAFRSVDHALRPGVRWCVRTFRCRPAWLVGLCQTAKSAPGAFQGQTRLRVDVARFPAEAVHVLYVSRVSLSKTLLTSTRPDSRQAPPAGLSKEPPLRRHRQKSPLPRAEARFGPASPSAGLGPHPWFLPTLAVYSSPGCASLLHLAADHEVHWVLPAAVLLSEPVCTRLTSAHPPEPSPLSQPPAHHCACLAPSSLPVATDPTSRPCSAQESVANPRRCQHALARCSPGLPVLEPCGVCPARPGVAPLRRAPRPLTRLAHLAPHAARRAHPVSPAARTSSDPKAAPSSWLAGLVTRHLIRSPPPRRPREDAREPRTRRARPKPLPASRALASASDPQPPGGCDARTSEGGSVRPSPPGLPGHVGAVSGHRFARITAPASSSMPVSPPEPKPCPRHPVPLGGPSPRGSCDNASSRLSPPAGRMPSQPAPASMPSTSTRSPHPFRTRRVCAQSAGVCLASAGSVQLRRARSLPRSHRGRCREVSPAPCVVGRGRRRPAQTRALLRGVACPEGPARPCRCARRACTSASPRVGCRRRRVACCRAAVVVARPPWEGARRHRRRASREPPAPESCRLPRCALGGLCRPRCLGSPRDVAGAIALRVWWCVHRVSCFRLAPAVSANAAPCRAEQDVLQKSSVRQRAFRGTTLVGAPNVVGKYREPPWQAVGQDRNTVERRVCRSSRAPTCPTPSEETQQRRRPRIVDRWQLVFLGDEQTHAVEHHDSRR